MIKKTTQATTTTAKFPQIVHTCCKMYHHSSVLSVSYIQILLLNILCHKLLIAEVMRFVHRMKELFKPKNMNEKNYASSNEKCNRMFLNFLLKIALSIAHTLTCSFHLCG